MHTIVDVMIVQGMGYPQKHLHIMIHILTIMFLMTMMMDIVRAVTSRATANHVYQIQ